MQKLTKNDMTEYLKSGALTEPFLSNEYVTEKVMTDYNFKKSKNIDITKLESLYNWIASKIKICDKEFKKYKFQRTAKEIWESGYSTGCTDYAVLFATFARQLGIPTTFLSTAALPWLLEFKKTGKTEKNSGHSFCECLYDGKIVLVDPTFRKITQNYNPDKIELSYEVVGNKVFIPYFRGLDLGKRMDLIEHNKHMEDICQNIKI